ncbi:hypothetical protein SAMN05421690_101434 [Nitrosomonas sp. Nm51]|nr:hypothetical protein SAMN05421690_101434 [Nitrosomonas sp. Nm51]
MQAKPEKIKHLEMNLWHTWGERTSGYTGPKYYGLWSALLFFQEKHKFHIDF